MLAGLERKILFILPTLKLTGGNLVVREYSRVLTTAGHEVNIVGFLTKNQNSIFSKDKTKALNYTLSKNISLGLFLIPEILKIRKILKRHPDFTPITVYTPLAFILAICYLVGWCRAPKVVVHDSLSMRWIGWVAFKIMLPLVIAAIGRDNIAVVSTEQCDDIGPNGVKPLLEIRNGISAVFFRKNLCLASGGTKSIQRGLFIGDQTISKGWDILVREMEHIGLKSPTVSIVCILAQKPRTNLAAPKYRGMEIRATGANAAEIADIMNSCEFLVHTSRSDSFALPIIEAMASGLVPICSRTQGSLMHARKGANIIFFDITRAGDLAASIQQLQSMTESEIRAILTTNRDYANRYSWDSSEKIIEQFIAGIAQ